MKHASPDDIDWHVLGAGSMGSLAAWRLSRAGLTVRRPGQAAVERTLLFADGQSHTVRFSDDNDAPVRALLLAVKAGDTAAALAPLLPRLAADVVLIRLQNGMGTLDDLDLPHAAHVVHAVTTDGAWRDGDQVHVVAQNRSWAGDGKAHPPKALSRMSTQWQGWQWCQDIEYRQWQKLAINAVINPLTALFDCRNGDLLDGGARQHAMTLLADELDALLPLWLPQWPRQTRALAQQVAQQTAGNTSSMLADVRAGRDTEVNFINGHVVRTAARHQCTAPENAHMVEQVTALLD